MLKTALRAFRVALAIPVLLASPAGAVGTIAFSLSQQLDQFGTPLGGCLLYTIQAGTTSTPQNAYKDTGLTNPQPNPMSCDGFGRLPQFFLADGQIKIRLTDKFGNPILTADNILVVGPSAGGGSGATIDPTTIAATGDLKHAYGTQVLTGWVRLNGRTIGSSTSGATERANADVQALFQYLWAADPTLVVVGGRGGSSIADWNANKQLTLPTAQNRALAGLGDMGNTDAALFAGTPFTAGNSTTLGSRLGIGTPLALARADLPNVTQTFSLTGTATSTAAFATGLNLSSSNAAPGGGINFGTSVSTGTVTSNVTITGGSIQSLNGGVPQTTPTVVSPLFLVTIYIKL